MDKEDLIKMLKNNVIALEFVDEYGTETMVMVTLKPSYVSDVDRMNKGDIYDVDNSVWQQLDWDCLAKINGIEVI